MTLLELLRQELPKHGGWPEGEGFAWQDDDGEVRFNNGIEHDFYPKNELLISEKVRPRNYMRVRHYDTFVVTREQYEAEHAIDEMVQLSGVSIGAAKILYDAGYWKG